MILCSGLVLYYYFNSTFLYLSFLLGEHSIAAICAVYYATIMLLVRRLNHHILLYHHILCPFILHNTRSVVPLFVAESVRSTACCKKKKTNKKDTSKT